VGGKYDGRGGGLFRGEIFDDSSFLIISLIENPIDFREFDVVAMGRDGR
jgi:hypothetical protein